VGGARDARGLAAATDRAGDAGKQKSLQSSAVIHTKTKARRGEIEGRYLEERCAKDREPLYTL
jgi:hypothetical protein